MKLIMAVIQSNDNDNVSHALTSEGFRVTCIASTGSFLRRGQSTLLIGVEDGLVERAMQIVRQSCSPSSEPNQSSGLMFVLKVNEFTHF